MKYLTSNQIRNIWDKFWQQEDKNHAYLKYASLVPDSKDKTVLFTTAGMQQLVPYLVGKPHPQWKRLYNIQKSLRTWDIDEVGDERHLTFFEMLWNWSLGDYFKEETIYWSVEFLNKFLEIPMERIWATIFAWDEKLGVWEDIEARRALNKVGIPDERIQAVWMEENFRWPAWEIGPCGPCCEFHVDRWEEWGPNDWDMDWNDRFLEVWNNVFMEFYKNEDGSFSKLKQQNVDTWMGLERVCLIMQNTQTVFETDLFEDIIKDIENFTKVSYSPFSKHENNLSSSEKENTKHFRIIADHIRTGVFMIGDGVISSNEWRWYVLRRLIRRLYYSLLKLNQDLDYEWFTEKVVNTVNNKYWDYYIELPNSLKQIKQEIIKEMRNFQKTINKGEKMLEEIFQQKEEKKISWEDVFKLYDTYGFPAELVKEIGEQRWYEVDMENFEKEMEKAREKSREGTKDVFKRWIDRAKYLEWISTTKFVGYENLEVTDFEILKDFEVEGYRVVVLDKSPFYPESWGQTADTWYIQLDEGNILEVEDVQDYAGIFLHFVK